MPSSKITIPVCLTAALSALKEGFTPIPIIAGTKKPAVEWDPWVEDLSRKKLKKHWKKHPDHELGILLNDELIVFDADTPEGVSALHTLLKDLDIECNRIVSTRRGEHHYFLLPPSIQCSTHTPDKQEHPERFDIKSGRTMLIIPPSTDKKYSVGAMGNVKDLVTLTEEQLEALLAHNGRKLKDERPSRADTPKQLASASAGLAELKACLKHLDPDMHYLGWIKVLMVIFYRTQGGDEGLELADQWSSGGEKYKGPGEIKEKWNSFILDHDDPPGIGTLHSLLKGTLGEAKYNEIKPSLEPQWDLSQGDTIMTSPQPKESTDHPLAKFSLKGRGKALKKEFKNHKLVLGRMAIRGQWTVIYAPPGTGKTLLLIKLIIDALEKGVIKPWELYYVNADDGGSGIATKSRIAEDNKFNMLVPGFNGFKAKDLVPKIVALTNSPQSANTILVLDTLKKFTDLMNKPELRKFGTVLREFTAKGGTVITLAHTNKNRDDAGRLIYAGATDIVDDADCMYVVDEISASNDIKTVEFENRKSRGDVARKAVYEFSRDDKLSYRKLLKSVREIVGDERKALLERLEHDTNPDLMLVELAKGYMIQGITAKTELIDKLAELPEISRAKATKLIDTRTGNDPSKHDWTCTTGAHNRHTYTVLSPEEPNPVQPPETEKEK